MVYVQFSSLVGESEVLTASVTQDAQVGFVEQAGIKGKKLQKSNTEVIQKMT